MVVTRKHIFQYVLDEYNKRQEEFSYKVFLTDCIGGFTLKEGFTRWHDIVEPLHERKDYKPTESMEHMRERFLKKFNESMVTG